MLSRCISEIYFVPWQQKDIWSQRKVAQYFQERRSCSAVLTRSYYASENEQVCSLDIYLFTVSNRNSKIMCKVCPKFKIRTLEVILCSIWGFHCLPWTDLKYCSSISIIGFEQVKTRWLYFWKRVKCNFGWCQAFSEKVILCYFFILALKRCSEGHQSICQFIINIKTCNIFGIFCWNITSTLSVV